MTAVNNALETSTLVTLLLTSQAISNATLSDLLVSSWTVDYNTENGPSGQDKTEDGTVLTQASHLS